MTVSASKASAAEAKLRSLPVLVSPGEIVMMKAALTKASNAKGFVFLAGDPNETYAGMDIYIEGLFRLLVAQVILIAYLSGLPTVKVGWIDNKYLAALDPSATQSDQVSESELLSAATNAYFFTASALNSWRALAKSTDSMMEWVDLVSDQLKHANGSGNEKIVKFQALIDSIDDALRFVQACGVNIAQDSTFREPEFYSCTTLRSQWYHDALTRTDSTYGNSKVPFCTSTHMLYISDNQQEDSDLCVNYLARITNPLCLSVSPSTNPAKLVDLVKKLNPNREAGKIVLSCGMGSSGVWQFLPTIMSMIKAANMNVVWVCDPISQNNVVLENGITTRPFDLILAEIDSFFSVCSAADVHPGGIRMDVTAENVKEIFGGSFGHVTSQDIMKDFEGKWAPRLNGLQSLELAFEVGINLRSKYRQPMR